MRLSTAHWCRRLLATLACATMVYGSSAGCRSEPTRPLIQGLLALAERAQRELGVQHPSNDWTVRSLRNLVRQVIKQAEPA